jgi:hypothetical protein
VDSLQEMVDLHCPPAPKASLWLRFGCGHTQAVGRDDDLQSFLENARDQPCDACALKRPVDQRFTVPE